ncbi:MAG: hypothetical protein LBH06_07410 [Rikenellaceae bacterium]|nr:hypothetical protein [Rikenellaceae bacterium]
MQVNAGRIGALSVDAKVEADGVTMYAHLPDGRRITQHVKHNSHGGAN